MDVQPRFNAGPAASLLSAVCFLLIAQQSVLAQFSNGAFTPGSTAPPQATPPMSSGFPASSDFRARDQNDTPFAGQDTAKINWLDGRDLDRAFQMAIEQNKPVMLHFWNERCQPCMALEHYVFPNPILAQAINSHFIPVKVNTMQTPEIHRRYGVNRWPWDVFVAPNGAKLREGPSPNSATNYTRHIEAVAKTHSQFLNLAGKQPASNSENSLTTNGSPFAENRSTESRSMTPVGAFRQGSQPAPSPSTSSMMASGTFPPPGSDLAADIRNSQEPVNYPGKNGPSRVENRFFPGSTARGAASQPSVGMEGFCPVSMLQDTQRTKGSPEWGCIHRGKLYFFASQAYRDVFMKDPDRFAPVLAGYDVVLYRETGQLVEGKVDLGGFVGQNENRVVFLFAFPETKQKFIEDRQGRYLETARIATRNTPENWLR